MSNLSRWSVAEHGGGDGALLVGGISDVIASGSIRTARKGGGMGGMGQGCGPALGEALGDRRKESLRLSGQDLLGEDREPSVERMNDSLRRNGELPCE